MADIDRQLVQRIADEVLAALRARTPGDAGKTASVRPPIGICTGDYSKFEELRGKGIGAPPPPTPPQATPDDPRPASTDRADVDPLRGFVTAEQLRAAATTGGDGVAVLAVDARLTPLANDLVREGAVKIRRVGTGEARATASAGGQTWLWWADGFCPTVQNLVGEYRNRLLPITGDRSAVGLASVVRELAKRVKEKRAAGGVLFVRSGALAMCYANRCRSLRAVLGTCDESVDEGLRELAANVLVIEYPHSSGDKARGLVERLIRSSPKPSPVLDRELRELGECG